MTKKEWEAYENSLWIARDNMACMAAAEIAAKEKGMAEGREEGRAAGMAEEKIATAKRLLAMGLNTSQVAQGAGLSMEEVEKLL